MAQYPDNRLVQHLMGNCVLRYACPAARNLCLGRYEAPLPVSRVCNARCVGCISFKDEESTICATPQDRLTFTSHGGRAGGSPCSTTSATDA